MGQYILEREMVIPRETGDVFSFFGDPRNLEAITPPWLHFKILTPMPLELAAGVKIVYRLRLHGIPIKWVTKITAWEPPDGFVDEQIRGPYTQWIHTHRFEAVPAGTRMRDRVLYRVPGGNLTHSLFVGRNLEKIFAFRQEAITRILTSANREADLQTDQCLSDS